MATGSCEAGGAPAPPPIAPRPRSSAIEARLADLVLGLIGFGVAVLVFTQLGELGLGLYTSALIVLGSLAMFIGSAVLVVRMTAPDTRPTYPLQLALPSLAYYTAFFLIPLCFLVTFAFATGRASARSSTRSTSATSRTRSTGSTSTCSCARCALRSSARC